MGRAGEGGGVRVGRAAGPTGGRILVIGVALLSICPPVRLSAQRDTVRLAALRVAQTRPDSARAMVRRLLEQTAAEGVANQIALMAQPQLLHQVGAMGFRRCARLAGPKRRDISAADFRDRRQGRSDR